jgi:tRNA pseudouridine13 synthase
MILRRLPEDFAVRETLREGVLTDAPGAVTVYELTKTSLTTQEAIARFSKGIGVRAGEVHAAGLKDKHALTTQHVSCAHGGHASLEGAGWRAKRVGWAAAHLDSSAIAHNAFTIVVRGLRAEGIERARERAAARMRDGALRCINYYGEQRFGSARHGQGFAIAAALKGDYETALRLAIATPARKETGTRRTRTRELAARWGEWHALAESHANRPEKRAIESLAAGRSFQEAFAALPHFELLMMVEAYQSVLWNRTVSRVVARLTGASELHPPADEMPEQLLSMRVPTLGPDTLLTGSWAQDAREVLREEGIAGVGELTLRGVRRPKLGTVTREVAMRVEAFCVGDDERDEMGSAESRKVEMKFLLGKGAYATVLIAALFGEEERRTY